MRNVFGYMISAATLAGCFAVSLMAADGGSGPRLIQKTAIFNPGEIVVYWTAPGDDGYGGRASGYDLRYRPFSAGPINTDQEWHAATQVLDEPTPSMPNHLDSAVVRGLEFGSSYYFCLKAYDNVFNYSGMSNSPLLAAGDTTGFDYLPGDANGNGHVNGVDAVYLVAYLKGIGHPPLPYLSGDANGNCIVNGIDVIYLVNYFKGWGAPPIRGDCGNPLSIE